MTIYIIELIVRIIQSGFFGYTIVSCGEFEKNKKLKMLVLTFLFSFVSFKGIPMLSDTSITMQIIGNHIFLFLFAIIFNRKQIERAIVSCSIVYIIMSICPIFLSNIVYIYAHEVGMSEKTSMIHMVLGYSLQVIVLFFCMINNEYLKNIQKYIIYQGFSRTIMAITFLIDFILIFCDLSLGDKNKALSNTLFIFFIGSLLLYFSYIKNRARKINALNKALEIKNNELRKIKHDYGAQISYLYGICLLGRYDDLKDSLKKIINNNDTVPDAVQVKMNKSNKESILSLALKSAVDAGIHVIIDDKCDLSSINIDEMELYRIFSNIVSNAVKAMNGNGTIIVKAYELIDNIIIKIGNNGPKIPDNYLISIFKPGFTTKVNKDKDHGFGLSITKELIEKNAGSISVKSTTEFTEFRLTFKKSN